MAKLLLVIDMQNDFVKGHMSTPEALALVNGIVQTVEDRRAERVPVLFTLDTHDPGDTQSAEARLLPAHCVEHSEGWRLIDELRPYADESNCFCKPGFMGLGLDDWLRPHLDGTPDDLIELCGVCTDICVLSNALYLRAAFPAARILVHPALCAGLSPTHHEAALTVMRSCLVEVADTLGSAQTRRLL